MRVCLCVLVSESVCVYLCVCILDLLCTYVNISRPMHLLNNFSTGDPSSDPNVTTDPFKTLFLGRIVSYCLCVVLTVVSCYMLFV